MKELKFYKKENNTWWLDAPEYVLQGGDPSELQMVAGADDLLEALAEGGSKVKLQISEQEAKDLCQLKRVDEIPTVIGKYYHDDKMELLIWLCPVTIWVFEGYYPENIWYKII
jgi:hypothetical protein